MTDIAGWLLAALLLFAILLSLLVLFQDRLIYFPRRYSAAQLEQARTADVQEIRFRTSRGNQAAFFWRNEDSDAVPQSIWLLFGGNGDLALSWLDVARGFPGRRAGFLLIDYPGYGICEGRPDPETILENAEGALQSLLEKKRWRIRPETLCVLGHSLGGAAALQFAAKNTVRKILVLSTFTSLDAMVRAQIWISLGPLLRHQFDNIISLKAILSQEVVPDIFILHGQADEIIPLKMGQALARLDPSRIQFTEIPGAGHNDIIQHISTMKSV